MKYLMGVDMGGTVVKAALFDLDGNEIAAQGVNIRVIHPAYNMMERDLTEARNATFACIAGVLQKTGIAGEDVLGIGVTGQGNGAYFFDTQGEPLCNGVMSSDMRAKEYIKRWTQDGTFEQVYAKTRQQLWAGNIVAIIAWFQDHAKDVLDRTASIVTAKDYVRYLLTGEFHTEMTEGSGMSCMDLETREYSREIFSLLGIEKHIDKIPAPIGSSEIGGYVTEKAAALTGLKPGTPVTGGQFDVCASIISAGVAREDQLGVIVGSWGINTILRKHTVDDPALFMQYVYAIPNYYALMEGSATSTSNLEWFIDACMERGEDIYSRCNELVQQAPWRDSLLFLPYLFSSNVNIDAKAMFVGLHGAHKLENMVRAIYEGVVFCHRLHIERLLCHGDMPSAIQMAGGAARSAVWMQLFADILGVRIEVSYATELGTMGVALSAGIGCGAFGDETMEDVIARWAKVRRVYVPDPEKTAYYNKKYHAFRSVINAMDGVWEEIDGLLR